MSIILCMFVKSLFFTQETLHAAHSGGTGAVKGVVLDSATHAGLPYATVALIDPASSTVVDGVITKDNGEYILEGLPLGEYKLKCTFMGYSTTFIENIKLTADNPQQNVGKIMMKPTNVESNTVVVKGEKENITYKLDKKVLNISENPNVQGGRLVDALQNIPSVSVDGEGKVSIRGSSNFQVLIDGKPSPMPGNDVLKSIPADAVENVELITNPSAKFDPDGTAGIINIVLKKADLNGFNGIVNCSAGTRDKYNASTLFNYRYNNMNYYAGIEYQNMDFGQTSKFTQERYSNDSVFYIDPAINRMQYDNSFSAKGGIEYTIDPARFLSFSGNFFTMEYQRLYPTELTEWTNPASVRNFYVNNDDYTVDGVYVTLNSYYQRNFEGEGHQLAATVNAIIWDGHGNELMDKYSTDSVFNYVGEDAVRHKARAYSRSVMTKSKMDYTLPLEGGYKLEAGYNFDYTQDFSDYLFQDLNNSTMTWEKNNFYSNDTRYFHTINAVYGTFSGILFGLNYQFGLRAEYFNRRLDQSTNRELFKYEKFSVFPTFHLSADITETQQIQFSFSKRIQRPDVYALNPFPDYADDYVVSVGNPDLMPEFTDAFELNYQKNFDFMFLSIQTFYNATDNAMTRVLKVKEDGKLWITSENVQKNRMYGGELSANMNIVKGLRLNLTCSIGRFEIDNGMNTVGEYQEGTVVDGSAFVFWSLAKNTMLQLSTFYMGERITTDGTVDATWSLGFTVRQSFFDKALTVYLNGRNMLKTMKYVSTNRRSDYYSYGTLTPEGANVTLGLTFNLNNYQNKVRPEDQIERTNAGSSGGY